MPKVKTSKGTAKRFRKTKKGKLKHGCAGKSHILTKKKRKRVRGLKQQAYVSAAESKKIARLIPYS